jgi:vacuolar-type H+-ATPase subunit I/STV1
MASGPVVHDVAPSDPNAPPHQFRYSSNNPVPPRDDAESLALRRKSLYEDKKQLEQLVKKTEEKAEAAKRQAQKARDFMEAALREIQRLVSAPTDQADAETHDDRRRSSEDDTEEESSGPDSPEGYDQGYGADDS